MDAPSAADDDVWTFAVALLRGETVERTDGAGMTWRATASRLYWIIAGEPLEVRRGDAFDVAAALVRELRRKAQAPAA